MLWFVTRNRYLVFIPISCPELLKPLELLNDERDECVFVFKTNPFQTRLNYVNEAIFLESP